MLAGLILIAMLMLTMIIGTPIALALARPTAFRRRAPRTAEPTRVAYIRTPFVPLELGQDTVKWPSEMPPRSVPRPVPPWPSELWKDEYFGQNRKKLPELTSTSAQKTIPPTTKKKKAKKQQQPVQQKQQQPVQQPRAAVKQVKQTLEDAFFEQDQGSARPRGAPSQQEIEALVGRLGLAGAVQEIMNRTGWDFRQAAHYLAKSRQKK